MCVHQEALGDLVESSCGLVEIVNITGLSLYRNLQMLSARGVCALESSSLFVFFSAWLDNGRMLHHGYQ